MPEHALPTPPDACLLLDPNGPHLCMGHAATGREVCQVTVWDRERRQGPGSTRPCGLPVVRWGLCEKHAADKERLS